MPDLDELFDQATRRVEAAPDALARQHGRQRRRRRVQRAAVFSIAAAIALVFLVGFWALSGHEDDRAPAGEHVITPPSKRGPEGLFTVALPSGTVGSRIVANVSAVQADISPDGRQLAFVRTIEGHEQIFISGVGGDDATQLTGIHGRGPCDCGATDPDWSPDDTTIVFSGTNIEGSHDLYTIDAMTGSVRRLTSDASLETDPDWSRDGTRIVFTKGFVDRERTSIWMLDLSTGRSREVSGEVGGSQPVWSPDDGTIAFVGEDDQGDGTDVWLMRPDGSDLRRLVDEARDDVSPAWSLDGTQIAFAAVDYVDGVVTHRIMLISTSSAQHTPTELTNTDDNLTDPIWSPGGHGLIGRRP